MQTESTCRILRDFDLNPTEKCIAIRLLHFQGENKSACIPIKHLAAECGVRYSTAQRAVSTLEAKGWLRRELRVNQPSLIRVRVPS